MSINDRRAPSRQFVASSPVFSSKWSGKRAYILCYACAASLGVVVVVRKGRFATNPNNKVVANTRFVVVRQWPSLPAARRTACRECALRWAPGDGEFSLFSWHRSRCPAKRQSLQGLALTAPTSRATKGVGLHESSVLGVHGHDVALTVVPTAPGCA